MGMSRGREKSFLRLFLCLAEKCSEIFVFLSDSYLFMNIENMRCDVNILKIRRLCFCPSRAFFEISIVVRL